MLSFSTAVSVAVERGAEVIPFPWGDPEAARQEAEKRGAVAASPKRTAGQQLSLSPASLRQVGVGTRLLLPSPNGSRLSLATGESPTFCSCLRNFEAVARAVRDAAGAGAIAVIPGGERWGDGGLRPAIEDWLGAGAVIAALGGEVSPEALTGRLAYEAVRNDLASVLRGSVSGRELIDRGFAGDVEIALEVGRSECAPLLQNGAYRDSRLMT
ncbi:MAG TPA: 2-phosphosulfolactate phosphatase [Caulobacteraceae bacterium]